MNLGASTSQEFLSYFEVIPLESCTNLDSDNISKEKHVGKKTNSGYNPVNLVQ